MKNCFCSLDFFQFYKAHYFYCTTHIYIYIYIYISVCLDVRVYVYLYTFIRFFFRFLSDRQEKVFDWLPHRLEYFREVPGFCHGPSIQQRRFCWPPPRVLVPKNQTQRKLAHPAFLRVRSVIFMWCFPHVTSCIKCRLLFQPQM